jgi:hypothetical protein
MTVHAVGLLVRHLHICRGIILHSITLAAWLLHQPWGGGDSITGEKMKRETPYTAPTEILYHGSFIAKIAHEVNANCR